MKYYIGDIEEQNGDYEDGHEWDEEQGHYWCDFTGIKTGKLTEISKEVYDALNWII